MSRAKELAQELRSKPWSMPSLAEYREIADLLDRLHDIESAGQDAKALALAVFESRAAEIGQAAADAVEGKLREAHAETERLKQELLQGSIERSLLRKDLDKARDLLARSKTVVADLLAACDQMEAELRAAKATS